MLKKSMKIVVAVLIAIAIVVTLSNVAFAGVNIESGWTTAQGKITGGDSTNASASVGRMASAIISVTQVVGMAVAVIMLIVLAIKYISAAPSDKADIKKHAVVYVVGAVVLFAASGILEIVKQFAANIHG